MPDEAIPTESSEDTSPPDESGPEGAPAESEEGSQASETDWQSRYDNLRPHADRVSQENAELRQLITSAQQGDHEAIERLGFALEEGEDEGEDDYLEPDDRIDRLEGILAERLRLEAEQEQDQEQRELENAHLIEQLAELETKHGEIADGDLEALLRLAESMPDEGGFPDLIAAHDYDSKRFEDRRKSWVSSKRTPQAPSGASATEKVDLNDPEQRREFMARRIAEEQSAA